MTAEVRITVANRDASTATVDVLVLKLVHRGFGLGGTLANQFMVADPHVRDRLSRAMESGGWEVVDPARAVAAQRVLFGGAHADLGYGGMRAFAREALSHLSREQPQWRSVAMTLQGPG